MAHEIRCRRCNNICAVEGDFPKFYAWCAMCDDYADFDMSDHAADYIGSLIDEAELRVNLQKDAEADDAKSISGRHEDS